MTIETVEIRYPRLERDPQTGLCPYPIAPQQFAILKAIYEPLGHVLRVVEWHQHMRECDHPAKEHDYIGLCCERCGDPYDSGSRGAIIFSAPGEEADFYFRRPGYLEQCEGEGVEFPDVCLGQPGRCPHPEDHMDLLDAEAGEDVVYVSC